MQAKNTNLVKNFGERLRDVRTEMALNQTEMADLLGVSRNYVGMLEGGERTPSDGLVKLLDSVERDWRRERDEAGQNRLNDAKSLSVREEPPESPSAAFPSPPPRNDEPPDVSPHSRPSPTAAGLYRKQPAPIAKASWEDLRRRLLQAAEAIASADLMANYHELNTAETVLEEMQARVFHGTREPLPRP